jgi:uroporphyrinogen III methyltransferase/synthase
VLLPRADIATETLAAGLTERGWEVDDVTAYRTVRAAPSPAEIRDAIKSGGFDAVLASYAVELREKLAKMPAKQRRGSKVQGPTALRFR